MNPRGDLSATPGLPRRRGDTRDREIIDSELRLVVAIRHMVHEAEGRAPSSAHIDELLDERPAATFPARRSSTACPHLRLTS